jgi:hypothetical protein
MNKKAVIYSIFFILFTVSCNGKNKNKVATANVAQKEMDCKKDTVSKQSHFDIFAVSAKMEKQEKLTETDYSCICDFLFDIFDKGKNIEGGEGIGYCIFEYFKNNPSNNISFMLYLNNKDTSFQDKIQKWLVQIMCIDISEENYTYDTFVKDFDMFQNSVSAKNAFNDCIENQVE